MDTRLRYGHMESELKARIEKKARVLAGPPIYHNLLPMFDKFHFEAPTLIVKMESGGEVLHAFGMFETGTSKMGLYAGQPSSDHVKQIMALGLDVYSNVPAGNVNLAGYCAYIQAWRGINAFFIVGGGDVSGSEPLQGSIGKRAASELEAAFKEKEDPNSCKRQECEYSIELTLT